MAALLVSGALSVTLSLTTAASAHAPDEAFWAHADEVIQTQPCDADLRLARARRLIAAGAHTRALADLDALEACGVAKTAPAHIERARVARQLSTSGELRKAGLTAAVRDVQRAIALEPKNPSYHLLLGELWAEAGAPRRAARPLRAAYNLSDSPDALHKWVTQKRALGESASALDEVLRHGARRGVVPVIGRDALRLARDTGDYTAGLAYFGHAAGPLTAHATARDAPPSPTAGLAVAELFLRNGQRAAARAILDALGDDRRVRRHARFYHDVRQWRRALGPRSSR